MNYIDYFAKGGKTRSVNKKTRSSEDIQKLLINASGASTPEEFEQKWALCAEANGGEENLVATLNEVVTAYENASDEELMSAFKEVFDSATSVFKCGGKMQRLSQRFARGGAADCGCKKKIPMHQGGNRFEDQKSVQQTYSPDGKVEVVTATSRDKLPINQAKDPESDWNIAKGEYLGNHIVMFGGKNGIDQVNHGYGPMGTLHGADSVAAVNKAYELMQQKGISPGIPRQNAADYGGNVYEYPEGYLRARRPLTLAEQMALKLRGISLNPALFR